MSDLIDRQAAKVNITRYFEVHIRNQKSRRLKEHAEEICRDICFGIDAWPSAQPEVTEEAVKDYCRKRCLTVLTNEYFHYLLSSQQWIPCSERMPEIDETVLITVKDKYVGDKEYHYHVDVADHLINDDWMTFNDWDEGQELEIVAWMPLPNPWKGEEQ